MSGVSEGALVLPHVLPTLRSGWHAADDRECVRDRRDDTVRYSRAEMRARDEVHELALTVIEFVTLEFSLSTQTSRKHV